MNLTQAVIFCGGRGTRLGPITDHMPKPMVPIHGRPFLEYLLEQLRQVGLKQVVLLIGYRGDQIRSYFADGKRFGMDIRYSAGPPEWETGQRLWEARSLLQPRFLLMYGDNFTPFRPGPLWRQHQSLTCAVTVTVTRKNRGNIRLAAGGKVECYDASRQAAGLTHVEIGYMLVERDPVLALLENSRDSFAVVLQKLAQEGNLAAFEQGDVYHSVSDPERWQRTEEYLRPKRIILLDRDGVINRKAPRWEYVTRKEEVIWVPETLEALEKLGQRGFEFIVLSNQAGIGRGIVARQAVDELHAWMADELRKCGIVVRDFLICPHGWDEGCTCRKPEPGLFFQASRKHSLRLDRTIYVGDDVKDAEAANRAGCSCLLIGNYGEHDSDQTLYDVPVYRAASLLDALELPAISCLWLNAESGEPRRER